MTPSFARYLRAATLVSFLATGPVAAAEDFLAAYRDGLLALEAEEWEVGARLLEKAIAERPEARLRLPRRRYLHPYVPHFYLGLAHFKLGDCPRAIRSFDESARQGVVAKRPRLEGESRAWREVCRNRLANANEKRREAGEWTELAQQALLAVRELSKAPEIVDQWVQGKPSLADRVARAEEGLTEARKLVSVEADGHGLRRFEEAKSLAVAALDSLNAVRVDIARLSDEFRVAFEARDVDLRRFADLRGEARRILSETAHLEPLAPITASRRSDLVGVLERTGHLRSGSDSDELNASTRSLSRALGSYRAAIAKPSSKLLRAAEALLGGDYDGVALALGGVDLRKSRVGSQASLLLSAARFNLYLIDGSRDNDLLESARRQAEAARAGGIVPPARLFSPRFIRFFETVPLSSSPSSGSAE